MDIADHLISSGRVDAGMACVFQELSKHRSKYSQKDWRPFADICTSHPIAEKIFQDPITRRSWDKPRGYPGDAGLLDLIYAPPQGQDLRQMTALGSEIYRFTNTEDAASAVRERRLVLAATIDAAARAMDRPRILSVASGHLREAEISHAIQNNQIGEFIALDQDGESCNEVETRYGRLGIKVDNRSIKPLLVGDSSLGKFDVIYAAGLYDYLNDMTAARLTSNMFNMLNEGGKLLIANFLPGIPALGYMESFMGWLLIFRNSDQLFATANDIPKEAIEARSLWIEPHQNIVYMTLTKH